MNSEKRLTLLELNRLVRGVIECDMPNEYWVEAELSECRESKGHCYMELVQKDDRSNTPVARASAKCWASKWMVICPYFERTTRQQLHAGMKVLLKVYAQFHEAYGFSWIVTDIDPTYTLGDLARRRQEIIRQLKEEGVFDLQKELQLPTFCQRIAVVSSETAAGYGDFCKQLSESGFAFNVRLFPAIMQGEQVEQSIIAALEQIYSNCAEYDCVVIIRGGGATADMSGFDTLALAENVANFPLPIITGIGHDRDECVLDMVSHIRVKTPTAAAALLIDHLKAVLDVVNGAQERIARLSEAKLKSLQFQLANISSVLPRVFSTIKARQEARLDMLFARITNLSSTSLTTHQAQLNTLTSRLPMLIERKLLEEKHKMKLMEEKSKSLDPTLLLQRGYSITYKDGHALHDAASLCPGDEIETRLASGSIRSTVLTTSP